LRIGIVGGIFGKDEAWQKEMLSAPERVLQLGLIRRGHEVVTRSLDDEPPSDCDIVHCHHFGYASLRCSTSRVPFVFTSHNPFIASQFHNRQYYMLLVPGMIVLNRADFVVALSNTERNIFNSRFGVPNDRIRLIRNGLIPGLYQQPRLDYNHKQDVPRLLYVAQLEFFKGIEYLLVAFKNLVRRYNDLQLDIVSQNRRMLKTYQDLCLAYGISSSVRFMGPLSMKELVAAYHRCTLYVHPSLAEDLPTAISEAMMCGKPVIASTVAGIPEQVDENVGILVPPGDPSAISEAVTTLLEDPSLVRDMGKRAKERAMNLFDCNTMCKLHEELYKETIELDERRGRRIEGGLYRLIWRARARMRSG